METNWVVPMASVLRKTWDKTRAKGKVREQREQREQPMQDEEMHAQTHKAEHTSTNHKAEHTSTNQLSNSPCLRASADRQT